MEKTIEIALTILITIIGIFGIFGNAALFVTFWKENRSLRFNQLMISLATFDFFYVICDIIYQFLYLIVDEGRDSLFLFHPDPKMKVILLILYGLAGCTVYTAVSICLERYLVLCHGR